MDNILQRCKEQNPLDFLDTTFKKTFSYQQCSRLKGPPEQRMVYKNVRVQRKLPANTLLYYKGAQLKNTHIDMTRSNTAIMATGVNPAS